MSNTSDGKWTAAELRETLEAGDLPGLKEAGLLDRDDLQYLLSYRRAVPDPEDDDEYQELLFNAVSKNMQQAIENGNLPTMAFANGIKSKRIDAERDAYEKLIKDASPAAHQVLFKGAKGTGKSTKVMDLVSRMYRQGVVEKVITNIKGPDDHPAVEFAEDISRFLEFAQEPGEKVAVFDEFSTVGNAYVGQNDVEQILSRVINAFRKSEGGSLRTFYIGHENDSDIHPIVRKQSDVVVQADGKVDEGLIDKATVFYGWQAYKSGDAAYKVSGLQDIPASSPWSFSTNYFAHLEFDLDNPEEQIDRGQLVDNWEQYQDGEGKDASEATSPERVKCRGVNSEGEGCGAMTDHESGYCEYHRDQWSEDAEGVDPRFN